jgi:hypothetical protein
MHEVLGTIRAQAERRRRELEALEAAETALLRPAPSWG